MGADAILDRLQECLGGAVKARHEVESPGTAVLLALDHEQQLRLHWLERQLATLVTRLQGIALDLESGLVLGDLGYAGADDFTEMLEGVEHEIRQLQRMIREVKGICR